jgi:hypothetical protein
LDLEGYWQENRRFVLSVTGGAVAFLIGWWAIDAYLGADLRALSGRRTRVQQELRAPMFQTTDLERAQAQNAALREATTALRAAAEFKPRERFTLAPGSSASSRYVAVVSEVREELLQRAGRAGLVLPHDLGLPTLAPTKDAEIQRTLEALDALERTLSLAIDSGCERVSSIRVRLDPRLVSGKPIDDLERSTVELRLEGASPPLARLLVLLQQPRADGTLLVQRAEMTPLRTARDEMRLDLELAVTHPHGVGAVSAEAEEG